MQTDTPLDLVYPKMGGFAGPSGFDVVPVLRAVDAKEGDMILALKSGNFGGPRFFSDALDLMR